MKKKYFWSLLTFMLVAMLSVGFASCGDDDDDDAVENYEGNGGNGSDTKTGMAVGYYSDDLVERMKIDFNSALRTQDQQRVLDNWTNQNTLAYHVTDARTMELVYMWITRERPSTSHYYTVSLGIYTMYISFSDEYRSGNYQDQFTYRLDGENVILDLNAHHEDGSLFVFPESAKEIQLTYKDGNIVNGYGGVYKRLSNVK